MKYLKKYETKNKKPEVWDYVILNTSYGDPELDYKLNTNIGQIIDLQSGAYKYKVKIADIYDYFSLDEIEYCTDNEDDTELNRILLTRKFNL